MQAPDICDEKTFFGNGIHIAFRHKLCIGIFHSDDTYVQIFGKTALGRKLLTCM